MTRDSPHFVTDEQHYMEYDKDPKYLLLETVNEEGLTYRNLGAKAPGGWAYEYGKGRVCYFSPGHLITVLWNPEYIKLQHNAVKWLMRATGRLGIRRAGLPGMPVAQPRDFIRRNRLVFGIRGGLFGVVLGTGLGHHIAGELAHLRRSLAAALV